jgi:iron complex outermembrane receptor protein
VLGLRWQSSPALTLHASVGQGFEAPTLGELAYPAVSTGSGFNTTLKAQRSRQLELGAKWRGADLALDATLYSINTSDEISAVFNQGGRSSFQNVGATRRYGAELGAQWRISPRWRSQVALNALHASYQDGFQTCGAPPCTTPNLQVDAGNRIAGTQGRTAYAELAWKTPWARDAEAALEWRAAARTAANDINTLYAPGYGLASLRYLQRFALDAQGALELLARVDNITDRQYAGSVIVNEANGRVFEPGAPRNLLLSLRYQRRW